MSPKPSLNHSLVKVVCSRLAYRLPRAGARVYHESIIEVQDVILVIVKCLLLDSASEPVKGLANLVCLVFMTGDLEPVVLAVVGELGLVLCLGLDLFADQTGIEGTDKSQVVQVINNLLDHLRPVRPQGGDVKLDKGRHFGVGKTTMEQNRSSVSSK